MSNTTKLEDKADDVYTRGVKLFKETQKRTEIRHTKFLLKLSYLILLIASIAIVSSFLVADDKASHIGDLLSGIGTEMVGAFFALMLIEAGFFRYQRLYDREVDQQERLKLAVLKSKAVEFLEKSAENETGEARKRIDEVVSRFHDELLDDAYRYFNNYAIVHDISPEEFAKMVTPRESKKNDSTDQG